MAPLSWRRKLRHRKVKCLARGHTAGGQEGRGGGSRAKLELGPRRCPLGLEWTDARSSGRGRCEVTAGARLCLMHRDIFSCPDASPGLGPQSAITQGQESDTLPGAQGGVRHSNIQKFSQRGGSVHQREWPGAGAGTPQKHHRHPKTPQCPAAICQAQGFCSARPLPGVPALPQPHPQQ